MKFNTKILLFFLIFTIHSKFTAQQKQTLEQIGCQLNDSEYYKNFMDQGNMMIASTQSGTIYEHLQILATKHFTLSPESTDIFERVTNEIQNLSQFKNEIDMQSMLQSNCQFMFNDATQQLEIFVTIQFFNGTYDNEINQQQTFEQKIITAIKMTLTLMKLHKNGYLHGDVQPKSFFLLNQHSFLLGNLQYLRKQKTLSDFNQASNYIEQHVKYIDGNSNQTNFYDVKSEIYSFGLIMKQLFLQEENIAVQPIDGLDQIESQSKLRIIDFTQLQQEQIQFFVDAISQMITENKQERMESLDTFLGTLALVVKTYYGVMTNKLKLNRTMNQEYIFLNSIKDQSLRFRLTNAFQQRKKFINFSMLNQKIDQVVKELTKLNLQIEQNTLADQIKQRNFSTVHGENYQERFSKLQDRESYFANQYLASNLDSHLQKALYDQKQEEMRQKELEKEYQMNQSKEKRGCCGLLFI